MDSFRQRLENTFSISERPLLPSQELRVRPLMGELSKQGIEIGYFITLTYPFRNVSWKNTVRDSVRTWRILRKFAKYRVRGLSFIERHIQGKHRGGYHRHLLCEDPFKQYESIGTSISRQDLSRVANSVFDKTSLEIFNDAPRKYNFKERLLRNALVKYNNVLADNDYSCVIKRENDVRSRVSYCTKQFYDYGLEPYDVVDFKNSDVDPNIVKEWVKNTPLSYK